jgi:oxygen-dependent protoporphyrinogen oxidase
MSGLAAAHRLQRLAPDIEIVLVEAEPRLGGKILTERPAGFVIEGGPDSFLASKSRGIGLCQELGMAGRLQGTRGETRRAYVLHAGTLQVMPEGLTGLVPSRLEPLLASDLFSADGKDRLRLEPEISPRAPDGDESLAAFVTRRFGREVYDRLIEPLMAGIYAGDGEQLSLQATFPQLRALELAHGSLIRGLQASTRPAAPGRSTVFATPSSGMAEIVESLNAELSGVRSLLNCPVERLRRSARRLRITVTGNEEISADAVILATPARASGDLLGELAPDAAAALHAIPAVSTATMSLAYDARAIPETPEGHGYVIPRAESRPALAVSWVSQKFNGRSPGDQALFRVFAGRAGEPDALARSDGELLALARDELESSLGIRAVPTLSRVFRWPAAMPQYTLGHLERLAAIDRGLTAAPGIFLAGALWGIGIPDCIASGESAAAAAAGFLGTAEGE